MVKRIRIENFKSIEKVAFNFENINENIICLIGKNGSGKSNIFKAIDYFFRYINKPYSEEQIIDSSNPYVQKCIISIVFDIKLLSKKAAQNRQLNQKFQKIEKYISENVVYDWVQPSEIELKLTQFKDGTIKWNVEDSSICNTIKNVFPIYCIDTRRLDLYTWDKLWQIISDLSIAIPQKSQEEYKDILDKAFAEIYGDKYISSKEQVENAFKKYGITLDQYHYASRYKNAFSMRFGGEQFMVDGHSLEYYSDGTSSFNYLKTLTTLIPKISELSCKYPIVLIDEPEIGLHNALITEFVDCLCDSIKKNAFVMLSTHSPKLIADLSCKANNYSLYKINRKGFYSVINKLNTQWLDNSKHKVTIRETECFFSDYLVYVEGETELQLFCHPKIRELFEKINSVHFYSFDSNDSRLKNVHSNYLNLGVPYKLIVDMDKILQYNKKGKFKIRTEPLVNTLSNDAKKREEHFSFYNHKCSKNIVAIRDKIEELIKNSYSLVEGKNYIDNDNYNILIDLIINYSKQYNVIVNWSTIEGELITYENIDEFIKYTEIEDIKYIDQHKEICGESDFKEKTILMMRVYEGKNEVFKKPKINNKRDINPETNKTSGWVERWITYIFANKIDTLASVDEKRIEFKKYFPNLYRTLQIIENMV